MSESSHLQKQPKSEKLYDTILANYPIYAGMVPPKTTEGLLKLRSWLGRIFRLKITDGRILVGILACTDRDANVVLTNCSSYWPEGQNGQWLGVVVVRRQHIVSLSMYQ